MNTLKTNIENAIGGRDRHKTIEIDYRKQRRELFYLQMFITSGGDFKQFKEALANKYKSYQTFKTETLAEVNMTFIKYSIDVVIV